MLPRRTTSAIGKAPTNSQKLIYISQKLGLNGIKDMQGSTVNIFDTVMLSPSLLPQVLEFFSNTSNKTRTFSNFQNGSLNSGETLVMEEAKFFVVLLNGTAPFLSNAATAVLEIFPFSSIGPALMNFPAGLSMSQMSVSIANQTVIKDYLISEVNPSFNPATSGIATAFAGDTPIIVQKSLGNSIIRLEAPPVLPPNQKLKVTLEIPALGSGVDNIAVVCVIGKFGSIYASKTTL